MNPPGCKRTWRKVISIAAAVLGVALAAPAAASDVEMRATVRARGTDLTTAIAIGRVVLAQPFAAQITRIRCEKLGPHRICGIVLSGVKFKRPLDRTGFAAEVAGVVRAAFATVPLEEVDIWATVPKATGQGVVVSGDFAAPAVATVFALSVPRAALAGLDEQLSTGRDVYWDAAFARTLVKGTAR